MHPRCADSYRVYRLLSSRTPQSTRITYLDTEKYPFRALEYGVFSVPAFSLNGRLVLQGYFEDEEVVSLASGAGLRVSSLDEAFSRLLKSVYYSLTVASAVYVAGDLSVVAGSKSYLMSASGAFFVPEGEKFPEYAARRLSQTPFSEVEQGLLRNIAGNFARDLYWLTGEVPTRERVEKLGEGFFEAWLLARASIGRVFVPQSSPRPGLRERVSKAWSYVLGVIDKAGARVKEEQESIPQGWVEEASAQA